jgi:hypothetical protein
MRRITKRSIGICLLVVVAFSPRLHAQTPKKECELLLKRVVDNRTTQPDAALDAIEQLAKPADDFTCFIEEAAAIKLMVPVKKKSLKEVLTAIQSQTNPGNQQQGTSVGSSATTDTVSKPSGPSAFIQNFGGISETTSGSSATYQWNPGTLINNLATEELVPLCNSSVLVKNDCFSGTLAKILVPMTLSVTSNTSNSAQSLTATAASTGSTSSVQQVNVSSKGSINPSFGGFSVKYVPWKFYRQGAKVPTTITDDLYKKIDADHSAVDKWLENCPAFKGWQDKFQKDLETTFNQHAGDSDPAFKAALKKVVDDDYPQAFDVLLKVQSSNTGCYSPEEVVRQLSPFLTDLLAVDAAIDLAKSSTPLLGFEYDLSTPNNLTSYSTVKANFSYQFLSPKTKSADQKHGNKDSIATTAISDSAQKIKSAVNGTKSGATSDTTPSFTFSAFFGAALYNSAPSSSIPSASTLRDIQGGAELSYLAKTTKLAGIGWLVGDTTLAAAYYYQDQTSPAILNGLPSTITFTGLPSNANTVFGKRGVINLAQVRLGFGSGKNITFPLSVTYSNRTELITHPTWGLQFGFNYNLSSLLTSTGGAK